MSLIPDTRIIVLNSLYSTPQITSGTYQKTFLSHVVFNTNAVLENTNNILYSTIGIDSAVLGRSFYNINYSSSTLVIQDPLTLIKYTITLTRGHYNVKQLLLELEKKINASIVYVVKTLSFDRISGCLSIVMNRDFTFLSTALGSTLLETIGFDNVRSYSSVNKTLISEQGISLVGTKFIKVVSNALQTNCLSAASNGVFCQQSILGIIPVTSGEYSLIAYNNSNDRDPILLNNHVNQIDISLYDQDNNFINFNNVEWSMCLRLTSFRNVEFNTSASLTSMLNQLPLGKTTNNEEDNTVPEFDNLDYLLYQKGINI